MLPLAVVASQAAPNAGAAEVSAAAPASPALKYWPADQRFSGKGKVSSWVDFPKHNEARRTLFAAQRDQEKGGLVFVGDSITEGWPAQAKDLADLGVKIVNRGIGGDTTPNLLYRLHDDVLVLEPRALVLLIGTNDIGEHTPPADIAVNLRELHARIRAAYPGIPIAWCLVMPRGDGPEFPAAIADLNRLIREIAASDRNVTICDTFSALADGNGAINPALFEPDRLHLIPPGYAAWRQALHPILASWKLGRKWWWPW